MLNVKDNLALNIAPLDRIGSYTWNEFVERIEWFHGYPAPGVLLGGIMTNLAMAHIPKGKLYNAVCETVSCLPDAIQVLTPCTVGNGWLRIINLGRYALSLYDKYRGVGVRVSIDSQKLKDWDEIEAWFMKLKSKKQQNEDRLYDQIVSAGTDIYALKPVQIMPGYLAKRSKGSIGICSICSEAYPVKDGPVCLGCQAELPYMDFLTPADTDSAKFTLRVPVSDPVG